LRFTPKNPPRVFEVGRNAVIQLKDCGRIELEPDEQVTFATEAGSEYDVVRKSWGFYATPSLNGRLPAFGLRAALVKGQDSKYYVFLVENGEEAGFKSYLDIEGHTVVWWLDSDSGLKALEQKLAAT
jgi:hypothetical protein